MINDSEISVIVQGPILRGQRKKDNLTENCLISIRQVLPKAEIILSTWVNSDTSNLDADIIIENVDPLNYKLNISDTLTVDNNVDRQIVSALTGLKASSRKYCLKIRTDAVVFRTGFISGFQEKMNRCEELKIFNERIVCPSSYNPKRTGLLFYFIDWFQFGLREDLINLWDIPTTRQKYGNNFDSRVANYFTEPLPEQYIWSEFLLKHISFDFKEKCQYSNELYDISEGSIINNVKQMDLKKFGIISQKHPNPSQKSLTYSTIEWLKLYKRYCDPGYEIGIYNQVINMPIGIYKDIATIFYKIKNMGHKQMPSFYSKASRIYRSVVR